MGYEMNYLAVLIGGILYFAIGGLWYSPLLFGRLWMNEMNLTEERLREAKTGMWKSYLTSLIAQLIISYGIARLMVYMKIDTLGGALHAAFWSWLAFAATTSAINGAFSGKSLRLYFIDNGYHLVGFIIVGVILGVWS